MMDNSMLATLLDCLLPAVDDLPGAGAMGLGTRVADVAGEVPRFGRALDTVSAALQRRLGGQQLAGLDASRQVQSLQAVEGEQPAAFAEVVELAYLVYYGDRRVHERIGWPASDGVQPHGFELPPFDAAVLEQIASRPPFWRPASS